MKKFYGHGPTYVQSVGVNERLEIDGFRRGCAKELDVKLVAPPVAQL